MIYRALTIPLAEEISKQWLNFTGTRRRRSKKARPEVESGDGDRSPNNILHRFHVLGAIARDFLARRPQRANLSSRECYGNASGRDVIAFS